jgi:hypothetical protein
VEAGAQKCLEILQFGGMGHTAGMHTASREAAIAYGAQMPASRIVINSPTTHGAIGFSTDLTPSMTLGCGSWGGNVTSDNVSPHHLMDIKRVAFETKPVGIQNSKPKVQNQPFFAVNDRRETKKVRTMGNPAVKREEIAAIVDKFLSQKLTESPQEFAAPAPKTSVAEFSGESPNGKSSTANDAGESPVKTIIHELRPQASTNGAKPPTVDFVSEDDVKRALEKGEKIFVTAKTIITPSARDLGDEREIFAIV